MAPLDVLYPAVLAGANLAVGWVLYALLEPVLGAVILVLGVLVMIAVLSETASRVTPTRSVGN